MKLEEGQKQNLHDFVQLGSAAAGLTQADLATGHRIAAAETPTDWKSMWRDLKIRLNGNFTFTKDQEKNIRGIAAIKKRPESLSLDNVAGVPAREQALALQVRSAGSSVRNALRKEILASIDPKNWVSLPQFVYDCVSKYKLSGAGIDIPDTYTAHIALLRRFTFDHPGTKPEPALPGVAADDKDTPRPAKKPWKAIGAQGGGCIATGEDFWGQVDEYFRNEIKTRGKSLIGPKWKFSGGRKPGSPIEPVSAGQPEQAPEGATVGTGTVSSLAQSHPGSLCEGNQDLGSLSCLWSSGWSSSSSSPSRVKPLLSAGPQVKTELVKTFMDFNVVPTASPPLPLHCPLVFGSVRHRTLRTGNSFLTSWDGEQNQGIKILPRLLRQTRLSALVTTLPPDCSERLFYMNLSFSSVALKTNTNWILFLQQQQSGRGINILT
ncbi:hypothetical protein B0H14DRAFT_2635652 [Mycena olivaceomarginata]|nr:hypothetical protein B0H14DRAFT_2635652 [Mycena olivaceomarginata]